MADECYGVGRDLIKHPAEPGTYGGVNLGVWHAVKDGLYTLILGAV